MVLLMFRNLATFRNLASVIGPLFTGLLASATWAANSAPILTPFYRGTQIQGELFGMGLITIPDYLTSNDIAFPYHVKPGFRTEIPFVDTFTINRVMGGYREDWLRRFHLEGTLGRRSLDYVVRDSAGVLRFRPELLRARLQPYLDAGYRPSDITLALDNTPWDLATPDGTTPKEGPWGRQTPPGDMAEWSLVVKHFASDLKDYLGPSANDIRFETGIEYDERASFDGSAENFFNYYRTTEVAIHSVLKSAAFGSGEFTAAGTCPPTTLTCVYDTSDLLKFLQNRQSMPSFVSRSLHSLVDRSDPWPSAAAQRCIQSYDRLPPVPEEVHQFGLLFEPFGEHDGGDVAAMQGSWEFQTLVHLIQGRTPRRVYHWGEIVSIGPTSFLDGSGFVRLVLDHYLGRRVLTLPTRDLGSAGYPDEVVGIGLTEPGANSAMVVSSFSPSANGTSRPIEVSTPEGFWNVASGVRVVTYKASSNIFLTIRNDLAQDRNLNPDFSRCSLCLGDPIFMATDPSRARSLVIRKWLSYEAEMKTDLMWHAGLTDGIQVKGSNLYIPMEANEIAVIEPSG